MENIHEIHGFFLVWETMDSMDFSWKFPMKKLHGFAMLLVPGKSGACKLDFGNFPNQKQSKTESLSFAYSTFNLKHSVDAKECWFYSTFTTKNHRI